MNVYDEKKKLYKMLSDQYSANLKAAEQANTGFSSSRRRCWNVCYEFGYLKTFIEKCQEADIPNDWYLWASRRLDTIETSGEYYSD
jgi:hypothetical protein